MSRTGDLLRGALSDAVQSPAAPDALRLRYLGLLLAAQAAAVLLLFDSYASMVEIWLRSETYHHGILIFPISAYLVWRRWPYLRTVPLEPCFAGLAAIVAASAFWWLCGAVGIQAGQHFAAVAMIPLLTLTIAGVRFARAIAFPLGYLAFAVPFGEIAIPYLIDFTAFFTVEALQLTGFPVLRDGVYFSIPAGDFEVAKACSGIRYLLSSLALGTLYGYLVYCSIFKRLAFFAFAFVLPLVANGLRAFGIVLLAHFSNMKLAVGVDHLVYGWIFFGLIMLLMFWVGDRFRDRSLTERNGDDASAGPAVGDDAPPRVMVLAFLLSLAATSLGPGLAAARTATPAQAAPPGLPQSVGGFRVTDAPPPDWAPAFVGASHELTRQYTDGDLDVGLAVVRYDGAGQGSELANRANLVADLEDWEIVSDSPVTVAVAAHGDLRLREVLIRSAGMRRLVWSWNEVSGEPVDGAFATKRRETAAFVAGRQVSSAAVLLSTRVTREGTDRSRALLAGFLDTAWSELHRCGYAAAAGCVGADPRPAGERR